MSTKKVNRKKLRNLMAVYDVKGPEVSRLLGRTHGTVNIWMCESGADILDETFFYLEHLLQQNLKEASH